MYSKMTGMRNSFYSHGRMKSAPLGGKVPPTKHSPMSGQKEVILQDCEVSGTNSGNNWGDRCQVYLTSVWNKLVLRFYFLRKCQLSEVPPLWIPSEGTSAQREWQREAKPLRHGEEPPFSTVELILTPTVRWRRSGRDTESRDIPPVLLQ